MIFLVSGVSGSGKSTIGALLADRLELPFYDADNFHPIENIEKMKSGSPLNDQDRQGWLELLSQNILEWDQSGGAVLACSALKESYRQLLSPIPAERLRWIILTGSKELIHQRMMARPGHFMSAKMLDSQFETFESPDYGWHCDISQSVESIVNDIVQRYRDEETS